MLLALWAAASAAQPLPACEDARAILQALGVLVLSEQFALNRAHEAFGDDGRLTDAKQQAILEGIAQRLVAVSSRLSP